jgi:hypothetical protein
MDVIDSMRDGLFWGLTCEFVEVFGEKKFLLILLRFFAVLKKAIQSFRLRLFEARCTASVRLLCAIAHSCAT